MTPFRIPDIVGNGDLRDDAVARLRAYYTQIGESGRKYFSGSHFDDFATTDSPANEFTSTDLLSVSLLGVSMRGDAVVKILDQYRSDISVLLGKLDPDKDLHTLSDREFDELLGKGSPGEQLWNLLRGHDHKENLTQPTHKYGSSAR